MTRGIVLSDIDYAKRLMEAGCPDSGIIAYLCWRGVEATEAAKLLDSLHLRQPLLQLQDPAGGEMPQAPAKRLRHRHHRSRRYKLLRASLKWSFAASACLLIVCCFGYVSYMTVLGAKENSERLHIRNPNWEVQLYLWQHDLPDLDWDELKTLPSPQPTPLRH